MPGGDRRISEPSTVSWHPFIPPRDACASHLSMPPNTKALSGTRGPRGVSSPKRISWGAKERSAQVGAVGLCCHHRGITGSCWVSPCCWKNHLVAGKITLLLGITLLLEWAFLLNFVENWSSFRYPALAGRWFA